MGLEEELKAIDDGVQEALKAKDIDKALSFHDDNIASINGGVPPGVGLAACKRGIKSWIGSNYNPDAVTFTPVKTWQDGDLAFQVNKWEGDIGQGPMSGSIKIFKKTDGQWKILVNATV